MFDGRNSHTDAANTILIHLTPNLTTHKFHDYSRKSGSMNFPARASAQLPRVYPPCVLPHNLTVDYQDDGHPKFGVSVLIFLSLPQ